MPAFVKDRIMQKLNVGDDGAFQALLDVAYSDWQLPQSKEWDTEEMLNNARFVYGEAVELATLLGKYNQQVTNGGHSQYFDNGCGGTHKHPMPGSYNFDVPLSERLLELMAQFNLNETELGKKVYTIAEQFVERCHGFKDRFDNESPWSRKVRRERDEDEEEPDMPDYDDLDTAYFELDEAWVTYLTKYFGLWIEYGEDPIVAGRFK